MEACLGALSGSVNFWFDGHFSGAGTYGQSEKSSQIMYELKIFFGWIGHGNVAIIAIDDARLFDGSEGHPALLSLAQFINRYDYKVKIINDLILINRID